MCQTRRKFVGNIIFLVIVVGFLAIYFANFQIVIVNGDSVALSQSGIVINGVKIIGIEYEGDPVDYTLSEGQLFVLGDNNLNSLDSREIGLLDSENILGVVI